MEPSLSGPVSSLGRRGAVASASLSALRVHPPAPEEDAAGRLARRGFSRPAGGPAGPAGDGLPVRRAGSAALSCGRRLSREAGRALGPSCAPGGGPRDAEPGRSVPCPVAGTCLAGAAALRRRSMCGPGGPLSVAARRPRGPTGEVARRRRRPRTWGLGSASPEAVRVTRSLSEADPRSGCCSAAAGAGSGPGVPAPRFAGGARGAWPHLGGGGSMGAGGPDREKGAGAGGRGGGSGGTGRAPSRGDGVA